MVLIEVILINKILDNRSDINGSINSIISGSINKGWLDDKNKLDDVVR